jgi:hypothetical protein
MTELIMCVLGVATVVSFIAHAFGPCKHSRTTFPQSERSARYASVTCLDCGRKFGYDWREMRMIEEITACENAGERTERLI